MNDDGGRRAPLKRPLFFTLRVWCETQESGEQAIRIEVKHILTGETRYFAEWAGLAAYLAAKAGVAAPSGPAR